MLTPEEIKKLIDITKPEGFDYQVFGSIDVLVVFYGGLHFRLFADMECSGHKCIYELFIQKCIEGINKTSYFGKSNQTIEIKHHRWGLEVIDHNKPEPKNILDTFRYERHVGEYLTTEAKEEALSYLLEQMG